jgi:hypothetical protein
LRDDVEWWFHQCDSCAISKGPRTTDQGIEASFKKISIDFAGLFPESDREISYLLFTKDFTKWPEI